MLIHTGDKFSQYRRFLEDPELTMVDETGLLALNLDAVFYARPIHE